MNSFSFLVSPHRRRAQNRLVLCLVPPRSDAVLKLFVVSIERGTSRRVYRRRPWLSDKSQLGGAPCRLLARPGCRMLRRVGPDAGSCPRGIPARADSRSFRSSGQRWNRLRQSPSAETAYADLSTIHSPTESYAISLSRCDAAAHGEGLGIIKGIPKRMPWASSPIEDELSPTKSAGKNPHHLANLPLA